MRGELWSVEVATGTDVARVFRVLAKDLNEIEARKAYQSVARSWQRRKKSRRLSRSFRR